jgi:superoxide dismutase
MGVTKLSSRLKNCKLAVIQTSNAETPFIHGHKPLLVADVWEHAYYLDYQNRCPDFLQAEQQSAETCSLSYKSKKRLRVSSWRRYS